ncbi:zinc ribbon domain-containing protein [Streptomyces sp. NPDC020800]
MITVDPRNTSQRCPVCGQAPRRTGPHGRSSTARRAAT